MKTLLTFFTITFISLNVFGQTWNGSVNTDWDTNANWVGGLKPTAFTNVIIPSAPTNQPIISGGTLAFANNTTVNSGATLTINNSGSLTINGSGSGLSGAFDNSGAVLNSGTINLGNTSNIGNYALINKATGSFTNDATGIINIDRVTTYAIQNKGLFNNVFKINIGFNSSSTIGIGIRNENSSGIFNNNTGGEIVIEKCQFGVDYMVSSTFINAAKILIGVNTTCAVGVSGTGAFSNALTGELTVNNASSRCISNTTSGMFTNNGKMNLVGGFYCIENTATFNNDANADVYIDGSSNSGFYNHTGGVVSNSGKITVGQFANVGVAGIYNESTFNNNSGAEINIVQAPNAGINNFNGTFINDATINIPAAVSLGLITNGTFTNNATGEINIAGFTSTGFASNAATVNNAGKITVGPSSGPSANVGFDNNGILNNQSCGQLRVLTKLFINRSGRTLSNIGYVEVTENLTNQGTFTNDGVLKYGTLTGSVTNATNPSIIVNNDPTPIFTYGGTYNGTVNGIFTDAAATISAGTFTAPNTFVPSNSLAIGPNNLFAKITPSGAACTFIVPFTYAIPSRPEINVTGNAISIPSGNTATSTSNNTEFGVINASTPSRANSFVIENVGNLDLTLGTNPVTITGVNAADFSVVQPSGTTITGGNNLNFQLIFQATVAGMKTATVSIANNDADENPYTFNVSGSYAANTFIAGDFVGKVKIKDGTQGVGKILVSDANGIGSWEIPSTATGLPASPNAGDMIFYNGTNWIVIPAGTHGQTLHFCSGVPTWGPCP